MLVCLSVLKCGSWVYEKFYSNRKHIIGGGGGSSSSSQAAKLSLGVLYGHFSRYHLRYYYGVLVTCRQLQVHWRLQTSLVKKYMCAARLLFNQPPPIFALNSIWCTIMTIYEQESRRHDSIPDYSLCQF
jgi:hypothetical protein